MQSRVCGGAEESVRVCGGAEESVRVCGGAEECEGVWRCRGV